MMREVIGSFFGIAVTPWKLVGFLGALMFAGRWLVQAWATRRAGRPTIPRSFWIISLAGSAMVTSYFIWGKNDSVGVLTNLLPASVAFYNLIMDIRAGRAERQCLISGCCWVRRQSGASEWSSHLLLNGRLRRGGVRRGRCRALRRTRRTGDSRAACERGRIRMRSPLVMAANAAAPPQPRQPSSVPPAESRRTPRLRRSARCDLLWLALALLDHHRHAASASAIRGRRMSRVSR